MSNAKAVHVERFQGVRNAFIPPSNPLVTPAPKRDNTPAVPLTKLSKLPPLHLAQIGKPTIKAQRSSQVTVAKASYEIDARYVVSDKEFIIRTRTLSIHDAEAKKYFFNNGGDDIVDDYSTLAQAYDALRRIKMSKLAGIKGTETRLAKQDVKIYVAGTVGDAQRIRDKARETEQKRKDNDQWLKAGIQRRTA